MLYRPDLYALNITPSLRRGSRNLPFFPTTVPRMSLGFRQAVCPTPYQPQASLLNLYEGA